MPDSNRGKTLLVVVIAISAIAVVVGTGIVDIPDFIGGPPGDAPGITYRTEVHIGRAYLAPEIVGVSTEETSRTYGQEVADSYEIAPKLLTWKGTLKLTINYPDSPEPRTHSKEFEIEVFDEVYPSFIWTSYQYGTHTLTVEMYNEEGTLVDSETVTVSR